MNPDPDLTIVLLGKTGVGKSASGNTILGRTEFGSKLSYKAVTEQICEKRGNVFGKQISVVDTPGLVDTNDTEEEIRMFCEDLLKSSRQCLFLVVLRVGRFIEEDQKAVRAAQRVLGSQEMNESYLLFTGGDTLKNMPLDDFIFEDEKGTLPDVVTVFAGAYHLFNNEVDDEEQVRELLLKSGHLRTQDSPADDSRDRRIVLLSLPGAGKSSSGNTILGSQKFRPGCDFNPVSTETVSESATVEGRKVTVVDTPGLTDEVLTPEQLFEEIMKSLVEASPGPHAFVVVVRIGRITAADTKLSELLPKLFDSKVCDAHQYSMVLFTHGDELEGRSIDDLIQMNTHVSALVSMCGGRYCVFDNKAKRSREQVRHFLDKVDEMVTANGGKHFTSDLFRMAERFINEERNLSGGNDVDVGRVWNRIKPFVLRHKGNIAICAIVGLGAPALAAAGGAAGAVGAPALAVAGRAAGAVGATALTVAGGAAGAVGATALTVAGGAAGAVGATALTVAGGAAGAVGATALTVAGGAAGAVGATALGVAGRAARAVGATALTVAGGAAGAVGATALTVAGGAAGAVGATALGVAGRAVGATALGAAGRAVGATALTVAGRAARAVGATALAVAGRAAGAVGAIVLAVAGRAASTGLL